MNRIKVLVRCFVSLLAALFCLGGFHAFAEEAPPAIADTRKSAEQGNAEGQALLGSCYLSGAGVPKDDVEAVKWLRKSAEQGYAAAQHFLGARYSSGDGVPKDDVLAYMWANLSAANGNENAAKFRETLSKVMSPEQIAEAQKLSREWQPKKENSNP